MLHAEGLAMPAAKARFSSRLSTWRCVQLEHIHRRLCPPLDIFHWPPSTVLFIWHCPHQRLPVIVAAACVAFL